MSTGTEGASVQAGAGEQSRRLLEESFNDGKFELVDQLVAPDAFNHDPSLPASIRSQRGPQLLRSVVGMYRGSFPDVRLVVDEVIEAGDSVALRWHAEGTHKGGLEGFAPTDARVTVTGISVDHWRDGKVVESWTEWDNLGLARQIGAAPPEGSAGEKLGAFVQRLLAAWLRKKNQ